MVLISRYFDRTYLPQITRAACKRESEIELEKTATLHYFYEKYVNVEKVFFSKADKQKKDKKKSVLECLRRKV